MTLGQKLRNLRKAANLSLRELGKKVGTDFTYLSKIENDKTDDRPPSEELLKKLAKELNADETELLFLAERIPDEAKQVLLGNRDAVRFLRNIKDKNLPPDFWKRLEKELESQTKGRKT
jgi:transcriptional regulator with XRE-family HTH domain